MTDELSLLLVFCALYLLECIEWVPRWHTVFTSWAGGHWRLRRPSREVGNAATGCVVKFPLPPLGSCLGAQPVPFVLAPGGVLLCALHAPNPGGHPAVAEALVAWPELSALRRDGRQLIAGNRPLPARACSAREAALWQRALSELAALPPEAREERWLGLARASLRVASARRCVARWRRVALPLRIAGSALFLFLFGAAPALVWLWGLEKSWPELLAGLVLLMLCCASTFFSLHRRLSPRENGERWTNTILGCLAPQHSIRLVDAAARPVLAGLHPLACARVLLDDAAFREISARWLRDLRHPLPHREPTHAEAKAEARALWIEEITAFLVRCGLSADELLAPPEGIPPGGSHCPRCHAVFGFAAAECRDCGGMATMPAR